MILKTTYKSHFCFKHSFKLSKKKIFIKNIVIFILFSKIFFLNLNISLLFSNKTKNSISLLKAPSRHKKFMHQIYTEYFSVTIFWIFQIKYLIRLDCCLYFFKKIQTTFLKIGSNSLTRTKCVVIFTKITVRSVYFIIILLYNKYRIQFIFEKKKNIFVKIKKPYQIYINIYSIIFIYNLIFFKNNLICANTVLF